MVLENNRKVKIVNEMYKDKKVFHFLTLLKYTKCKKSGIIKSLWDCLKMNFANFT